MKLFAHLRELESKAHPTWEIGAEMTHNDYRLAIALRNQINTILAVVDLQQEALDGIETELLDAAGCIQCMKDGNNDEGAWDRLRTLRHSFFGKHGAGLAVRAAIKKAKEMGGA